MNSEHVAGEGFSLFHALAGLLWRLLVAAVILLAVYVSAGRLLMENVAALQPQLLAALNRQLPFRLDAERLSGRLVGFSPELVFSGLTLSFGDVEQAPLRLARGTLCLDPVRSLLSRSPQASTLTLSELALEVEVTPDGRLALPLFQRSGNGRFADWLLELLPNISELSLEQAQLQLRDAAGELRQATADLALTRVGSTRSLDSRIATERGNTLRLHAEGIGNPLALDSWRGDIFMDIDAPALGAVFDWLPGADLPVTVAGSASIKAWLIRDGGRSDLTLQLAGESLTFSGAMDAWQLPLESLAMDASLAEEDDGWRLYGQNVALSQAGQQWRLPRVQFYLLGDSLELRAQGLRLDGLDALIGSLPGTAPGLVETLATLRPRGELLALRLFLEDLRQPARHWDVLARVNEFAVESLRGAPGIAGATALGHLYPGGGSVVLDSDNLILSLPRVYQEPLHYHELYGSIDLAWNPRGLALRSGLMTARGDEGAARALVALDVPFDRSDPTGPIMNLLVGLRDSDALYRAKYLPYRLPQGLRDWLSRSIGSGRVAEGGFAWRGSLRKKNYPHLTVQLYFDLFDAAIAYDPRWPVLEDFAGQLLIDDTRISLWADAGHVYDSKVELLSAETWRAANNDPMLAVNAVLQGNAGDGLRVVNNSPLAASTAGALAGWQAQGEARTALQLLLPLRAQAGPPEVNLDLRLTDTALTIDPGALALADVSGQLRYRSGLGLSGSTFSGELWEQPVQVSLAQDGAALVADLSGAVEMSALFRWLQLEPREVAVGTAATSGQLRLARGQVPALTLASDLRGVALELPAPWGKDATTAAPLTLQASLGRDGIAVSGSLANGAGGGIAAEIALKQRQLVAAAVQLEADWLQASLNLGGSAPGLLVDWLDMQGLPEFSDEGSFAERLQQVRPLSVHVLDLRRGGDSVGHLSFKLERDESAILLRDIRGSLFGAELAAQPAGTLRWWEEGNAQRTALQLAADFGDLGETLAALGYARSVVSERGSLQADFWWPGSPAAITRDTLQGSLNMQLRDGRLVDAAGGSAGALKMVSLLNVAELLRGTSLSQMFESGIAFERAESEFVFHGGSMEVPVLNLDGPASEFAFSGLTDFATIDGELVVTLPVASNLPWVAALAAGLPVAAGVYVVSKVFEKQVKTMSSGVYSVSGSLAQPEVKLRRIFDDTAATPVAPEPNRVADELAAAEAAEALDPGAAQGASDSPVGDAALEVSEKGTSVSSPATADGEQLPGAAQAGGEPVAPEPEPAVNSSGASL